MPTVVMDMVTIREDTMVEDIMVTRAAEAAAASRDAPVVVTALVEATAPVDITVPVDVNMTDLPGEDSLPKKKREKSWKSTKKNLNMNFKL